MLQLWIGRSGSGKSYAVWERLAKLARQGRDDLYLIVPEQYSFESERNLLRHLGAADAVHVQVLSFTRLADRVFREVGGMAGEQLDDGTRTLLMSCALEQALDMAQEEEKPLLGISKRQAADTSYIERLLSLWQEMKQCRVGTDTLEEAEEKLRQSLPESSVLTDKVRDLRRVFSVYEGLAASTGLDDWDWLTRLSQRLPDSKMPDGAVVFVDGFKGFTAQELDVLERLMPRVECMTITLTGDTPGVRFSTAVPCSSAREFPLFSPVTETVRQLQHTASKHSMSFDMTMWDQNLRTQDKALQTLEKALYAPAPPIYEGDADSVTVTECFDVYEECQWVARTIRRLLRQDQRRCRDITVVMRNPEAYQGILDDALEQEGIPFFADERRDWLCEPLIAYIRSALRMAVGGIQTEELLRFLKTDLGPLDVLETAQLENYLYMWRINGAGLTKDFTENPAGLCACVTADTIRQLAELNELRRRAVEPLMAFRQQLKGHLTGRGFAMALYAFLTEDKALAERLTADARLLGQQQETVLEHHASRLWDAVMDILDRFVSAIGDVPLTAVRAEELFLLLVQQVDLGRVPASLDAVTVGAANRIRYDEPAVVFLLGANEGVFPAYPTGDGLVNEEERRLLKENGVGLAQDLLQQCVEERYYVYTAVSAPTQQLFVSYLTKEGGVPSAPVTTIRQCLPNHCRQTGAPDWKDLESRSDLFRQFAGTYDDNTVQRQSARRVLNADVVWQGRLRATDGSADREPFRLKDPDVARQTFGTQIRLSASQTDLFYQCRFSYFCRYGLRVNPRRTAQVDASHFGTIVHMVMETLLPRYTVEGGLVDEMKASFEAMKEQSDEQKNQTETEWQNRLSSTLKADIHQVLQDYLKNEMGGNDKSGRFLYQLGLAEKSAYNLLWHTVMELRQSKFRPTDFELSIFPEQEGKQAPENSILSVKIPFDRGQIQVAGKIDRVDLFVRFDGKAFVRVVDYKTGAKKFDLNELTAGLNTQMLLYLFVLCDNSARYLSDGETLHPAGVLYHPLSDLTVDKGSSDGQTKRLKSMCMSGLVLDNPDIVLAMDQSAKKVFVPVGLKKDGTITGEAITEHQFQLLRNVVEQLLVNMATDLLNGNIEALPLSFGDDYLPCNYCDYRAICTHEQDDVTRDWPKRGRDEVMKDIETEQEVAEHGGASMDNPAEEQH